MGHERVWCLFKGWIVRAEDEAACITNSFTLALVLMLLLKRSKQRGARMCRLGLLA